jgi:hypothetical protein
MIVAWPFELWFFIGHGRPPGIVTFLLFVISGLFWAAVVDVLYELKRKYGIKRQSSNQVRHNPEGK